MSGAGCGPRFARTGPFPLSVFTAENSAALDGPEWLRQRRAAAARSMRPLPTAEAESWRYTPINDLDLDHYEVGNATVTVAAGGASDAVEVIDAAAGELSLLGYPEPDGLTDLHDAFVPTITVVRIGKGKVVDSPVEILVTMPPGDRASFPHVVIDAGESSESTVVVTTIGGDGGALSVPVVELQVGQAANLRYVESQQLAGDAWQLAHLLASVGRDATLKGWIAATGGGYAREYVAVRLADQGGSAHVAGVYFGDTHQVLDFRSLQDHVGPRTVSDFQLKGAVVDEAHGVYTGLIRVREGAKATESFLGNRNLVLGEGAHVDSVPNLEIVNENDIRSCGHAAATGPVDEDHVFYLESRGVPTAVAQRLIVTGFFEEILQAIPVEGVADATRHVVARKIDKVTAGGVEEGRQRV